MERLIQFLCLFVTLLALPEDANAHVSRSLADTTYILIRRHLPISSGPRPSRTPPCNYIPISVSYVKENGELVFYDIDDDVVFFQIYDGLGECALSGDCTFDNSGFSKVSICGFAPGQYVLSVFIKGIEYRGTFEVG